MAEVKWQMSCPLFELSEIPGVLTNKSIKTIGCSFQVRCATISLGVL